MKDLKSLNPADYLAILWRRKWFALGAFLIVAAGVSIYSWRMPNLYRSEAQILVEPAIIPQDYVRSSDRSTPEEQIAGIRQQLQSRSFMERMIQEYPNNFGYGASKDFSMDEAVKGIIRSIQILSTSRNTAMISFTATDAQFAQTFTRRIVEALIQSNNSSRKTRAVETDQFLDDQLRQTEQNLATHEDKIKQFKTAHFGELPEQDNANMNVLTGLNAQLVAVENALQQAREQQKLFELRSQTQSSHTTLSEDIPLPPVPAKDSVLNSPAPDPILQAREAELAALLAKYTPNHPDVLRLSREVEERKKKAAASMASMSPLAETQKDANDRQAEVSPPGAGGIADIELSAAKVEEDSIKEEIAKREKEKKSVQNQINLYQTKLKMSPGVAQELMALSREYEVLKQQYTSLTGKKFQAQMTANLETNKSNDTYRVIDEANLPEKPAFPDRKQIAFLGIGAAFVLGIGAAFGRELIDTTLCSEDEATAVLKLPVLVTVSEISRKKHIKMIGPEQIQKSA